MKTSAPAAFASEAWIDPSGWWWVVTRAPWLTNRRRTAPTVDAEPPFLADGDPPAGQRARCLAEPLPVPDRRHQLRAVVA